HWLTADSGRSGPENPGRARPRNAASSTTRTLRWLARSTAICGRPPVTLTGSTQPSMSTSPSPASTPRAAKPTWRLLLGLAVDRAGKPPTQLGIADLAAPFITDFLTHLEHERGNSARTRNARLSAIRSFYRYAALRHPEHAALIARVLDIPAKRR